MSALPAPGVVQSVQNTRYAMVRHGWIWGYNVSFHLIGFFGRVPISRFPAFEGQRTRTHQGKQLQRSSLLELLEFWLQCHVPPTACLFRLLFSGKTDQVALDLGLLFKVGSEEYMYFVHKLAEATCNLAQRSSRSCSFRDSETICATSELESGSFFPRIGRTFAPVISGPVSSYLRRFECPYSQDLHAFRNFDIGPEAESLPSYFRTKFGWGWSEVEIAGAEAVLRVVFSLLPCINRVNRTEAWNKLNRPISDL
ncbi:hypothetical protein EDB19DRAFT_1826539 [Suillus lakei]|nr:hypothetical protein EDB19DRAFT_1826539 [Suillus lakei]